MAVIPGKKITQADLIELADQANALTSTVFDLSAFFDVSPMYWNSGASSDDGSGKYGYATFAPVTLVTRGTGYTVGQYAYCGLVAGFTDHPYALKLRIEAVDSVGGILSLRPIQTGAFPPGTYTAGTKNLAHPVDGGGSPLTSDTGTGAQITVGISQVGPTKNYSFPDFDPNSVASWNFYIVDGGTGYTPGDVLGITELSLLALTVNSVDGAGKILTWTLTHNTISTGLPADVLAMPVTGGSGTGATFGGMVIMGQNPGWATELARLRDKVAAIINANTNSNSLTPISPYSVNVSGLPDLGWPISAPSSSYGTQWFYYEDTGNTESITITSLVRLPTACLFTTAVYQVGSDLKMISPYSKCSFKIGGTVGGLIQADFIVRAGVYGTVSGATGLIDVTVNFPATITKFTMPSGNGADADLIVLIRVNSTFAPGRYDIEVNITQDNATQILFGAELTGTAYFSFDTRNYNSVQSTSPWFYNGGTAPVLSATFNVSTSADGIDGVKNLRKIELEADPVGAQWGFHPIQNNVANTANVYNLWNIGGANHRSFNPKSLETIVQFSPNSWYLHPRVPEFTALGNYIGYRQQASIPKAFYTWRNQHIQRSTMTTPEDLDISLFLGPASVDPIGGQWTDTPTGVEITNGDIFYYGGVVTSKGVFGQDPPPYSGGALMGENCNCAILPYGWNNDPWPQPKFYGEYVRPAQWTLTTTVAGFWAGIVPMVSDLHCVTNSLMPWNLQRTRYGLGGSISYNPMLVGDLAGALVNGSGQNVQRISNSYDNGKLVEEQMEPPAWKANTWFSAGFTIMDSNGNLQTVQTAGGSGASAPGWSTILGGTVTDGTGLDAYGHSQAIITWKCVVVNTPARSIKPAVHRLPNLANGESGLPRFPVYWDSETVAKMKPPTGGSDQPLTIWGAGHQWKKLFYQGSSYDPGWHDNNLAYGWWIYSVSLSRMSFVVRTPPTDSAGGNDSAGDTGTGAGGGGGNEVAVTIGCIRSGAFVAFGTYATGQTIQVLWPVFTSDALVYQCSERVDIQAVAIASDNTVGFGSGVNYPILSAYVNDTENLLTLINQN